ncbi:hypothetical protein QFC20_001159 [Naganishia adeliensis]|uniref:Uncharacterized protein n=1 Tax=Naganishia adeliensis TaxID=92952 RepID=A0ACC2WXN8_9TREE|nr:hypothetical protein QFC20_001159 [Naganishia adeliensis]
MPDRYSSSSNTLRPYLNAVRSTLTAALTLENFSSQVVERHNLPEVEAQTSVEVLLNPLIISRNESERVLVEPSINSIRISIAIKQADEIERILCKKFTRFMTMRAENFVILRRKPVEGYDISFLITNFHGETMLKHKLVDFIIEFMQDVDKEISEMKLSLNARARIVAESYLSTGHIAIETTPFPKGEKGDSLDRLARQYLYADGLNFGHGVGHGIGSYLGVHEGPQGIPGSVPFEPGHLISNEPGFYLEGQWGIRTESVLICKPAKTRYDFGGTWLGWERITRVPIQTSLVDFNLLSAEQRMWLKLHNEVCRDDLMPLLTLKGDERVRKWLKQTCK